MLWSVISSGSTQASVSVMMVDRESSQFSLQINLSFVMEQWRQPTQSLAKMAMSERGLGLKGSLCCSFSPSSLLIPPSPHLCGTFSLRSESCLDGSCLRCQWGVTPKSGWLSFTSPSVPLLSLSLFCFHPLPPLLSPPPTIWKRLRKSLVSCLFLSSLPGSNLSHEWLLQCGHGTSCHMGDLISVRLKHNQLPPKTSQEHDDYCFPLILVLISKVTAHC